MILDLEAHELVYRGKRERLSPQEFALAEALFKAPGKIVGHDRITCALYGDNAEGGPEDQANLRKVLMCHLRRKLRAVGWPGHISTLWCVGYRAVMPQIRGNTESMQKMETGT